MAQLRAWATCALVIASIGFAVATPVRTSTCPSVCVCRQPTKRADCRDIPEWDLKMSAAQVVRIAPPVHHLAPGPLFLSMLESFPKVQMLSVTNRSIAELIPGTLMSLQVLDLSHNKLSRFSERTFHHMPALRKLTLEDNPIALKDGIPLLTSSSIRTLDLSHCGLTHIPNGSLDGIPFLSSLYLQGNPLKLQEGVPLVDKPSIQDLDLSMCKLTKIPRSSLGNLVDLRRLFLRGNDLKTISFGEIPLSVHILDLSANRIRDVPLNVLSTMKNLTTLELANNPLRCTCDFISFLDRLSEHNVIFEKMIVCAEPQKYAKVFWKDINESELCKDDIPSEESNDTSSDSGGSSTASFSFEKEESSYEADMHPDEENRIGNQHAPPFLLNHLLQKQSRLQNMEENSIQGDQPHPNTSDEKSDYINDAPAKPAENELHSEDPTKNLKDELVVVESTEARDESSTDISSSLVPKKTTNEDDDSLIVTVADDAANHEPSQAQSKKDREALEDEKEQEADFEKAPDASVAVEDTKIISKPEDTSEESTENADAETFMKNAETIGMGKLMPNTEEVATFNETAQAALEQPILLASRTQGEAIPESGNETAASEESNKAVAEHAQSNSDEVPEPQHFDGYEISPTNDTLETSTEEGHSSTENPATENAETSEIETEKSQTQSATESSVSETGEFSQTGSYEELSLEAVSSNTSPQDTVAESTSHIDIKALEEVTENVGTSQAYDSTTEQLETEATTTATELPNVHLHESIKSEQVDGEFAHEHDLESIKPDTESEDNHKSIESEEEEGLLTQHDHESIKVEIETTTKENVAAVTKLPDSGENALEVETSASEPTTQEPLPEATVHRQSAEEDAAEGHHASTERAEEDNEKSTSEHRTPEPPTDIPPFYVPEIHLLPGERANEPEPEESTTKSESAQETSSSETVTTPAAIDKNNHLSEVASGEESNASTVGVPPVPAVVSERPNSEEDGGMDKAVSIIESEETSVEEFSAEGNMQRVSGTDVTPVDTPAEGDVKAATIAYALIGSLLVCVIVAVACVSLRTNSDNKRNGAAPVRIRGDNVSPGTEMKDMMNPLLEPIAEAQTANEFHDDPARGSSLNGKFPIISPVSKEGKQINPADLPNSVAEPENVTEVVIEAPSPSGAANSSPTKNGVQTSANGKPPRQNGTSPSKVKIKESVIPPPRTPVIVKKVNGKS